MPTKPVNKGFLAYRVLLKLNTKEELEERIYRYFDEVNREPVIYHWKYKMDEISEEEAASV